MVAGCAGIGAAGGDPRGEAVDRGIDVSKLAPRSEL